MLLVDLWSIAFWISKITKRKGLDFTQHREKLKELVWPNRVNGLVNNCNLRKGGTIKSGAVSFWKKSKRLLTPPPSFWKIILQIFYDRYGSIYARRYDGQIVWNACTWFPKIWTIQGLGVGVNCHLESFRKFIRFGSVTRPLDWYDY